MLSPTDLHQTSSTSDSIPEPVDVVILSNGPGEVATWVKPVVRSLRQKAPNYRISVILSPALTLPAKSLPFSRNTQR